MIEGADRVGKSTHAAQLVQGLQELGHEAKYLKFPDRTTVIGKMIDEYLRKSQVVDDHVVHLLFSANRWEWFERMKSELESGTNLIVDRYAFSGVAYSAAKPVSCLKLISQRFGFPFSTIWVFINLTLDIVLGNELKLVPAT